MPGSAAGDGYASDPILMVLGRLPGPSAGGSGWGAVTLFLVRGPLLPTRSPTLRSTPAVHSPYFMRTLDRTQQAPVAGHRPAGDRVGGLRIAA